MMRWLKEPTATPESGRPEGGFASRSRVQRRVWEGVTLAVVSVTARQVRPAAAREVPHARPVGAPA